MTYRMFTSLCCALVALSVTSEAFQSAQPIRSPVSSSSLSVYPVVRKMNIVDAVPVANGVKVNAVHGANGAKVNAVHVANGRQEVLSKQIASLEIALQEQNEGVPVEVQQNSNFKQETTEMEGKLAYLQEQFERAIQEVEAARDHERASVSAVQTEARKKMMQARSEGRAVSERVRIDMTSRLSTKDQEIKQAKISLAQKESLIQEWSAERVSVKGLLSQAVNVMKSRSHARGVIKKQKAHARGVIKKQKSAERRALKKEKMSSEWSASRESSKILSAHLGQLIKSSVKMFVLLIPFVGASILKVGAKKEE
jgi:hypothetical protein